MMEYMYIYISLSGHLNFNNLIHSLLSPHNLEDSTPRRDRCNPS